MNIVPDKFIMLDIGENISVDKVKRNLKSEVESFDVGGGIWRIKQRQSASSSSALLIAAMHGGFLVLDKDGSSASADRSSPPLVQANSGMDPIVAARYAEHSSLAYGADWLGSGLVATCSFYDHMMRIWTY